MSDLLHKIVKPFLTKSIMIPWHDNFVTNSWLSPQQIQYPGNHHPTLPPPAESGVVPQSSGQSIKELHGLRTANKDFTIKIMSTIKSCSTTLGKSHLYLGSDQPCSRL